MFTHISQLSYQSKIGNAHIWLGRSIDSNVECILAGTLLGSEIIRIRAIRGIQFDESRYQLSTSETGTLPYHSWIVNRGDEQWPEFLTESQVQATLEPYLQGFSFDPKPGAVLRQYTELTGHMPLPPRWALGYHQSRWGYTSAEQVMRIAKFLRERNHPCDAIWLDIDYMHEFRNFTWNTEQFPDPA